MGMGMGMSHEHTDTNWHKYHAKSTHIHAITNTVQRYCSARAVPFGIQCYVCMCYNHTSCSYSDISILHSYSCYLSLFVFILFYWIRRSRVKRLKCAMIETLLAYFVVQPIIFIEYSMLLRKSTKHQFDGNFRIFFYKTMKMYFQMKNYVKHKF